MDVTIKEALETADVVKESLEKQTALKPFLCKYGLKYSESRNKAIYDFVYGFCLN